jgi:hypothetical protein
LWRNTHADPSTGHAYEAARADLASGSTITNIHLVTRDDSYASGNPQACWKTHSRA